MHKSSWINVMVKAETLILQQTKQDFGPLVSQCDAISWSQTAHCAQSRIGGVV
ncbi:hypothetical protein ACSS6W_000622 [Trichoderma asperelloides]